MRVIVAPDKLKGSASALVVAQAIADGVRDALEDADVAILPLADGGEGTMQVLADAREGVVERHEVTDPIGRPVNASYARLVDGSVVVEAAAASGLHLLEPRERDAGGASSFGTGELVLAALRGHEPRRMVIGVGGTASTDGGTGAARAAGWSFLDTRGRALAPGGAALIRLARIVPPSEARLPRDLPVVAACDVSVPLLGPRGAALVFAAQKGASPAEVARLEEGLENLAGRIAEDLGVDVAGVDRGGAGGGLGAGLAAFFGAELVSGFDLVADEVGLIDALAGADVVITGEGRVDDQSLAGKCTGGVARLCADQGVTCVVLAGEVALSPAARERAGFHLAVGLTDHVARAEALARPADLLRRMTRDMITNDWI